MDYQSIATFIMEMAGTVAFAASGAMVGVERNMDIFGVSVLGVATAVGGGMKTRRGRRIRDCGQMPDIGSSLMSMGGAGRLDFWCRRPADGGCGCRQSKS